MNTAEIYSKILEVSEKSYYRWKKKDHVILINLIEKYFTDRDLEEFLNTGKITKLELLPDFDEMLEQIAKKIRIKLGSFLENYDTTTIGMYLEDITYEMKSKNIELSLINFLSYVHSNPNNEVFKNHKIDTKTKIACIAAISTLNDYEFEIFEREGFTI